MYKTLCFLLTLTALCTSSAFAQQYHLYDSSLVSGQSIEAQNFVGGNTGRTGSASDDFNRADGTNMGPDWTEISGDNIITGNMGAGNQSFGVNDMTHNSASCPYDQVEASVDFLPATAGPSVAYVVLIAGVGVNNIYVKIQDNDADGLYDRCFFYHSGNGGGTWNATWFFDLATPVTSGRITLSFPDTDTAQLDVDGGAGVETFTVPGILSAGLSLGTSVGLGSFATAAFDNWDLNGGGCSSVNLVGPTPGVAGTTNSVAFSCATANGNVAVVFSFTAGSTPVGGTCPGLNVDMNNPNLAGIFAADASGNGTASGFVPPGLSGSTILIQAVDITGCLKSNLITHTFP